MPVRGSSSMPALPAASGGGSRSGSGRKLAPGISVEALVGENESLQQELHREKQKFQTMYVNDMFKSPARRRLEPMRKLVVDQSEATSQLGSEAMVKQQQHDHVAMRVGTDALVHERRMHDVTAAEMKLQHLEESLAMADGDAADACDREETYQMMEARLINLTTEDQGRLNQIQRVIDESKLRLTQWLNVSREGEGELNAAEVALAELRASLREERESQRKMLGERREMVESMVKYSAERKQRQEDHQDKLMAERGDLDAAGEQQLRTAAGTIDALRAINMESSKQAVSFEEKCRRAFSQIEGITGAKDLNEVLFIVTSKSELASQLQQRVEGIQERRGQLEKEMLETQDECTKERYGGAADPEGELKDRIGDVRERLAGEEARLGGFSKELGGTMAMLQASRLTWESVHRLLEPGKEPEDLSRRRGRRGNQESSSQAAMVDKMLTESVAAGGRDSPTQTPQSGAKRGGSRGTAVSDGDGIDLSLLPRAIAELPALVEEIGNRGARLLELIEASHAEGANKGARRRAPEPEADEPGSPGSEVAGLLSSLSKKKSEASSKRLEPAAAPSAEPPMLRERGASKAALPRTVSKQEALLSEGLPSNNIRVMPVDLAEALLEARLETPEEPAAQAAKRTSKGAAAAAKEEDERRRLKDLGGLDADDGELVTREDMKAAALRLARKAARGKGKAEAGGKPGTASSAGDSQPATSKGKKR